MNKQVSALLDAAGLEHQDLFPIREVARLTGVNPVTLRAWERRYGLIQPTRTDSGHRLYSQADIEDIRHILGWLERGVAVSKVGGILARARAQYDAGRTPAAPRLQLQVRDVVRSFDLGQLDRLFDQVFASHTLDQVFAEVFMPVWHGLAAAQGGFGQTSEWLFLDQFLRGRAQARLQLLQTRRSRRVVLAPLTAQCRELELLVASLQLSGDEVEVLPLAPGQPVEELTLVCERLRPDALVLFANQLPGIALNKHLARLLPGLGCPLLLAGEAAEMAQESLTDSPVACLGAEGGLMRRRLARCLDGQLDS